MKKLFALLLALCMIFALAACGQQAAPADTPAEAEAPAGDGSLVGVAMPTKDLQRWNQDGENMKAQLEAAGYTVDLQFGANDIATQVSQIENMIANGCKVLVIASIDGDSLGTVLAQAKEAGIPVIAYDRLIMNSDAVSYYATFDNWLVGTTQGEFIRDALDLDNAEGPFNIEFITGDPGDNNINFFFDGAMSILQPYLDSGKLVCPSGQTEKAVVATANWATDAAQARFENILSSNYADGTPLHAVLASNDSTAQGVENALAASYTNDVYPVITGQDCDMAIMKNLVEGRQAMSVFKDTRTLAAKVVEMVDALMKGAEPPVNDTKTYDNGTGIIPSFLCSPVACTVENYKELLIDSGYYTYEQIGVEAPADAEAPAEAEAPAGDGSLVGVAMPTKDLQRWNQDGENMKAQLEAAGYTVDLQFGANDIATQVSQIENMIANGCKVLVIASIDGDSLGTVLAQAKEAGIPVIAYDRLIMNSDAVSYYATFDNWLVGTTQGEFIRDALDLDNAEGPFNIEFITGDPGDNNINFFFDGAMSILQPYLDSGKLVCPSGQTEKAVVATANWATDAAQARFENILSSNYADGTPLHAVLASNDSTAQGVENALAASYTNDVYPVITGQDCDMAIMKNLVEGRQAMSVFKDTRTLAAKVVEMVDALMKGAEPPVNDTKTYDNGTGIIPSFLCSPVSCTVDNYQELLIDSGYYTLDQIS